MTNRQRGQRRLRRRLQLTWRQKAREATYEARRAGHRWLCRHVAIVRWAALVDAQWADWDRFVRLQEKHRKYNDYLCWKAERQASERQRNS